MSTQGPSDIQDPYRENRALIEDICAGCCLPSTYCTLKEVLIRSPKDIRTMMQIKCIEKLKYERSCAAGRDIGWGETYDIWIREGYADAFAKLHRGHKKVSTLYAAVMKSITPPAAPVPPQTQVPSSTPPQTQSSTPPAQAPAAAPAEAAATPPPQPPATASQPAAAAAPPSPQS
jgi:hypothetical protein